MVLLTTTPQVLDLISSLPESTAAKLQKVSPDPIPTDASSPISHSTLIALSRLLRENSVLEQIKKAGLSKPTISGNQDATPFSLNNLLRNTRIYTPPPPPKPDPSPEYVAFMSRLRAEAERKQYRSLVSQQTDSLLGHHNDDASTIEDQDPLTPSLVINIFLSVILSGAAVFIASRWWGNEAMRVLLSIAGGIIVGIAEVVVYSGYVRNVRRSRIKEKQKKERKVVLGGYTGAEDEDVYDGTGTKVQVVTDGGGTLSVEREVIWGKGKHGGMRRRIRDKWEKDQEIIQDKASLDRRKDE